VAAVPLSEHRDTVGPGEETSLEALEELVAVRLGAPMPGVHILLAQKAAHVEEQARAG